MNEEVREHREEASSLIPPARVPFDLTNTRTAARPRTRRDLALPTVVVDGHNNGRERKKAIGLAFCLRRNWVPVTGIAMFLIIYHYTDNAMYPQSTEKSPAGVRRDYSNLNGLKDLNSDYVEPWCISGQKARCNCEDPMVGSSRLARPHWSKAHHRNVEAANARQDDVDVLFLGDSITERWNGMAYGHPSPFAHDVPNVFQSLFTVNGGGEFEGLALGISGDTSPNLLWRIQNGELPRTLNPPVIWLLIGTNDFGNTWCAAEVVVIGILRIVEELRLQKPGSTIVVNGLLPRTFNNKGYVDRGRKKGWFGHSRPAMPSLWDDIEAVNDELKRYCAKHDKVEYFETDVFFKDKSVPEDQLRIDSNLMSDYLHPSAKGYKLWGGEIVAKLQKVISQR